MTRSWYVAKGRVENPLVVPPVGPCSQSYLVLVLEGGKRTQVVCSGKWGVSGEFEQSVYMTCKSHANRPKFWEGQARTPSPQRGSQQRG